MSASFDIIATRTLDVVDDAGRTVRQLHVHIGRPSQEPTGEWALPYQVTGIDPGDPVYRVFGIDAIQALQGVCLVIGGLLAGLDEAKQGRLRWGDDTDLGFPIPPATLPHRL